MKEINSFLDKHYQNAIKLCKDFESTKEKKWGPLLYLNELYVQVGHVYNIINKQKYISEPNRVFNNMGDEISDILLQLVNLAESLNIDMMEIKTIKTSKISNINALPVLLGQLSEILMEEFGYRFRKERCTYNNSYDFVKERIFKMFIITYNYAKKNNLDISNEFQLMLDDANNFLNSFKTLPASKTEFVDIYNDKEEFIGYSEKGKARLYGYWHKKISCLFMNPKTKKVYFSLNGYNNNNNLTLTSTVNLKAGENEYSIANEIYNQTGINISFPNLIKIDKQKNEIKTDNGITKEISQIYLYSSKNINLEDFTNFNNKNIGFIELDINSLISLLETNSIIYGKISFGDITRMVRIEKNSFDLELVNEEKQLLKLLLKIKQSLKKDRKKRKWSNFNMYRKINKLYKQNKNRRKNYESPNDFDKFKICNSFDLSIDNIKYSVKTINTDDKYFVYLLMIYNNKAIPYLLLQSFNEVDKVEDYYENLCNLLKQNTNKEIVDKCFDMA